MERRQMKTDKFNLKINKIRKGRINLKKGFMAIEYAFLIAIIVSALIGMSVYIKRALCARWREVGDSFGGGMQYDTDTTVTTYSGYFKKLD